MVDNPLILCNDQSLIIAQPCRDCQQTLKHCPRSSLKHKESAFAGTDSSTHMYSRGMRKAKGLLTSG